MKTVRIGTYNKEGELTQLQAVNTPRKELNRNTKPHQLSQETPSYRHQGTRKIFFTKKRVLLFLLIIIVFCTFGFAAYRWSELQKRISGNDGKAGVNNTCSNILDPSCWTAAFRPQLMQHNGYTNALIVGLDTRESGRGSDLQNTDTIMVARLNHETGQTMLISIPRDFWVTFKIKDETGQVIAGPFSMKINSVYMTGEIRNDVDNGIVLLQQVVEDIIGQPIHYTSVVKLKAVEDVVDTFGGVNIYLEDGFVAKYPNDNPTAQNPNHWLRYEFQKGENHLDGEKALVYSRFRYLYSGDSSLSSDFSRGERQQEIITALKEKAFAEEISLKDRATKYWDILQTISKNVEVNITSEDMLAGLDLINKIDKDPISIVLDPNFGGSGKYIYHPPTDQNRGYVIEARDKTYKAIQEELEGLWKWGALYNEQAHLVISNRTGASYPADDKATALKNHEAPLGIITYLTEKKAEKTGIRIYDFTNGKNPETIDFLKEYFETDKVYTDPDSLGISLSPYKENIKIVVGPAEPTPTPTSTPDQ
ncbi:LCP family protein [Candidatus Dojkabacteria bacterium]|nr:LCP family protein [Candidatus Dojkabacteria bacterium]